MAIKYLYIDDNLTDTVSGQVAALNQNKNELEIVHQQPMGNWEEERTFFLNDFSKVYDGLIIDLRLDDEKNSKGLKSFYKGTSLAQELRTLSTEKAFKEIPIVLLSATAKIEASLDNTGEDLFDIRISKEKITDSSFAEIRNKLIALGNAYKYLIDVKKSPPKDWAESIFKAKEECIDNRFYSKALGIFSQPIHSFISFVIKSFLSADGILISKFTLLARLGIDLEKSKDVVQLISKFDRALYRGILHEGWRAWWAYDVEQILSEWFPEDVFVRNIEADKRVEFIKKATGITDLVAAEKLQYSNSAAFWTHCKGTNRPIDPIDGLMIANQENTSPWEEKKYISIFEALTRKNVSMWQDVAATEAERLKKLKTIHTRDRVK